MAGSLGVGVEGEGLGLGDGVTVVGGLPPVGGVGVGVVVVGGVGLLPGGVGTPAMAWLPSAEPPPQAARVTPVAEAKENLSRVRRLGLGVASAGGAGGRLSSVTVWLLGARGAVLLCKRGGASRLAGLRPNLSSSRVYVRARVKIGRMTPGLAASREKESPVFSGP